MKKKAISVTEAARNFAECINRVHYQNVQYVLLRNGTPLASLVPERVCTGRDLAEALEEFDLPAAQDRAWVKDLSAARKRLKTPKDKWR
jgi:antitoxin (DNA-binding transcriptional repressor) of toxin-antitoxin stability system